MTGHLNLILWFYKIIICMYVVFLGFLYKEIVLARHCLAAAAAALLAENFDCLR